MSDDPITGREPSLGGWSELTGREPLLGGEGSLAALLQDLGEIDDAPSEVLVGRIAGVVPQLAPLLDSDDPRVRRTAARLIGIVAANHPPGREQTVPLLIKILDDALLQNDTLIIEMAIDRLGDTQDSRAVIRLLDWPDIYRVQRQWSRITQSLVGLGEIAVPALMEWISSGALPSLGIATRALAAICRTTPTVHAQVAAWLLPILLDTRSMTFEEVVSVAIAVGHALPVEQVLGVINDDRLDLSQRVPLVRRLSIIPDRRVTAAMLDLLKGDRIMFYHYAAEALIHARFREDVPDIVHLIEHPQETARYQGLRIAGRRRIKKALPLAIRALEDSKAKIREEAVRLISRIRDANSIPLLMPLLKHDLGVVRCGAAETLIHLSMNFPQQYDPIAAAIHDLVENDPDPKVRSAVRSTTAYWLFQHR